MRRYRMTGEGETPVWASRATLQRMARQDAQAHHRRGDPYCTVGNLTYDEEYRRERERLEKERDRGS